jgi:hypothetical protein
MEKKIREYEKFIEKKAGDNLGPIERAKLAEYHKEMMANFQHERLIHLIVMFFFVSVTLILLAVFMYSFANLGIVVELIPFYVLTSLMTGLSAAYVKHYFFLENHVQKLYKYSRILRFSDKKS